MDEKIETSQQKAGEISDPGGKDTGAGAGQDGSGSDGSPTGISTTEAMSEENQLKTTQQIRDEHSKPESD